MSARRTPAPALVSASSRTLLALLLWTVFASCAALLIPATPAFAAAAATAGAPIDYPSVATIPIDFFLFALTLVGIALFHRHTLAIALAGMIVISLYKILFSPFREGPGATGWLAHLIAQRARRAPRRIQIGAMMAIRTAAAATCRMWRIQSIPEVWRTPSTLASQLPTMPPTIPRMTVSHSGMACRPGMMSLASNPMTSPAMAKPRPPSPVRLIWLRAIWPRMTPSRLMKKDEIRAAMAKPLVRLAAGAGA